jgi:hypothetical protein
VQVSKTQRYHILDVVSRAALQQQLERSDRSMRRRGVQWCGSGRGLFNDKSSVLLIQRPRPQNGAHIAQVNVRAVVEQHDNAVDGILGGGNNQRGLERALPYVRSGTSVSSVDHPPK